MTADHRAEADRLMREAASDPDDYVGAYEHLLAAIHDGQREQTALLVERLLAERLPTKGDPCPCGCRRDVEPKPHEHFWKRQQNVTSRGYAMDAIEVCECGTARRATDPEPETVTVSLPRDVVTLVWARLDDALSDALDAEVGK